MSLKHVWVAFASVGCVGAGAQAPYWDGPALDPLLPFGGVPLAAGANYTRLLRADNGTGTYNMSPMIGWFQGDSGQHVSTGACVTTRMVSGWK